MKNPPYYVNKEVFYLWTKNKNINSIETEKHAIIRVSKLNQMKKLEKPRSYFKPNQKE